MAIAAVPHPYRRRSRPPDRRDSLGRAESTSKWNTRVRFTGSGLPGLAESCTERPPHIDIPAGRGAIHRLALESEPGQWSDESSRVVLPAGGGAHFDEHVGPRVMLERQRLLCTRGVHPIAARIPGVIVVRVAATTQR